MPHKKKSEDPIISIDKAKRIADAHTDWLIHPDHAPVGWFFDHPDLVTDAVRDAGKPFRVVFPKKDAPLPVPQTVPREVKP
jgi:hypothetical protein